MCASALRIKATHGPVLILQDTTEFSFKRASPEKIGFTKVSTGRKLKEGRYQKHAICGLLMHASLAITPEGLPLGLTAAKFWSRSKFKGTAAAALESGRLHESQLNAMIRRCSTCAHPDICAGSMGQAAPVPEFCKNRSIFSAE